MSVEIWPPIAPEQLKIEEDATQARELTWLLNSLQTTLQSLRHGLEECYALLAPIDPGSTLVLSTPRAELVKGHVTRVGARIVKGTIHTRLRTMAPLSISINPAQPIHLAPLVTLRGLLTQAVDLAALCFAEVEKEGKEKEREDRSATASFLAAQLRQLAQAIDEASAILKGGPSEPKLAAIASSSTTNTSRPGTADPSTSAASTPINTSTTTIDTSWTRLSAASSSFTPPLNPTLSFHVSIQDACLVLHLRALEPVDAPLNLGIKLALAIGTTRRLEHDEADRIFAYCHHETPAQQQQQAKGSSSSSSGGGSGGTVGSNETEKVYVREKVRVESADPSLLSMATKLTALSNTLGLARRNLAAVMGADLEA